MVILRTLVVAVAVVGLPLIAYGQAVEGQTPAELLSKLRQSYGEIKSIRLHTKYQREHKYTEDMISRQVQQLENQLAASNISAEQQRSMVDGLKQFLEAEGPQVSYQQLVAAGPEAIIFRESGMPLPDEGRLGYVTGLENVSIVSWNEGRAVSLKMVSGATPGVAIGLAQPVETMPAYRQPLNQLGMNLVNELASAVEKGVDAQVEATDDDLIMLTLTYPDGSSSRHVIAPEFDYRPILYEQRLGEEVIARTEAEYRQLDGVAVPVLAVTRRFATGTRDPYEEVTLSVQDAKVNFAVVGELFAVDVPDGAMVSDTIRDVRYIAGQEPTTARSGLADGADNIDVVIEDRMSDKAFTELSDQADSLDGYIVSTDSQNQLAMQAQESEHGSGWSNFGRGTAVLGFICLLVIVAIRRLSMKSWGQS